ncbi:ATP-binding SpoIIE family protein phosphatase [Actinomycetospora straminea]|uniref:ATP-binding SpoIIE family protein phosphatase n=1 Tax=Actinomycetospora straminea TaxID=663607 RepID=UPI0023668CB2|nr:SpoIIE family protein phosphatase [Actinomycetospora straminea]MDD7934748.1 SpoIIE family protein phosphatase [Actinomycetospora straminea]
MDRDPTTAGVDLLAALDHELQALENVDEIMVAAARRLGEHLAADRCAYAQLEADEDHFTMSGGWASGLPHLTGRFAMSAFGAAALAAMRRGEPWVVEDAETDPRLDEGERMAYAATGIRAVISVPVMKAHRFVAGMAVHQARPRRWTPTEVDLAAVVTNRCWESLARARAIQSARGSEDRFRRLFERATDGIWLADQDGRFLDANPAACAMMGWSREQHLDLRVHDLVRSEDQGRLARLTARLRAGESAHETWEMRHRDGGTVAVELSIWFTPDGLWQAIGRDVTARRRAEDERERLYRVEHELAQVLQHSLLPRAAPALARLTTATRYRPATTEAQAGGDWYDLVAIGPTTVALAVGDVVGHGPRAAAIMGQLRSALSAYLLEGHPPADALERLDRFAAGVPGALGSTCACLTLDWETGVLTWALAGHLPMLLVDDDGVRFPAGGEGIMLGVRAREAPYRSASLVLAPGASVLLYTDGLVERRGEALDEGLERLLRTVAQVGHRHPEELATGLVDAAVEGDDGSGAADDIALVVVRWIPAPLRLRLAATPASLRVLRREVTAWAAQAGLSKAHAIDLHLALGEAATNVIEHAYPEAVGDLLCEVARADDGAVQVVVADEGRWRTPPEDPGHRGRGLVLIRELAVDVEITLGSPGTRVVFRVPDPEG